MSEPLVRAMTDLTIKLDELKAENKRLRKVLKNIASGYYVHPQKEAKQALEQSDE